MDEKIIVYSTYYNPIEANIVKARLEDSEIPCFLTDENISTIQPLYNQAVGGVKLNIFERDIEKVQALLQEQNDIPDIAEEVTSAEKKIVCSNCGSTNVGFGQSTKNRFSWWVTLISFLLAVYPFKTNNCYHCYDCGHEFK